MIEWGMHILDNVEIIRHVTDNTWTVSIYWEQTGDSSRTKGLDWAGVMKLLAEIGPKDS